MSLHFLTFLFLMAAFFVGAIGYGRAVSDYAFPKHPPDSNVNVTIGVAVFIFLGGLLNALGIAFGSTIDIVLGIGVALFVWRATTEVASGTLTVNTLTDAIKRQFKDPCAWLTIAVFFYMLAFTVPNYGYNPHDDYTQYLVRPGHMLQFGSLSANWFDSTGADSLGAQSWMQAFFLHRLPISYAAAFDGVICLTLSIALLSSIGQMHGLNNAARFSSAVAVIIINPSQVNASSIYSSTLMLLGLFAGTFLFALQYREAEQTNKRWLVGLVPAVLFCSALPALKMTMLVYVIICCVAFLLLAFFTFRSRRDALTAGASVIALGLIGIGPWLLVFVPQYSAALNLPPPISPAHLTTVDIIYLWAQTHYASLLSLRSQYGQFGLATTVAVFAVLGVTVTCLTKLFREKTVVPGAFAFVVLGSSACLTYLVSPALTPWGQLRYFSPILIATFPLTILAYLHAQELLTFKNQSRRLYGSAIIGVLSLAVVLLFHARGFTTRVYSAFSFGTALAIAEAIQFTQQVEIDLGPLRKDLIASIQNHIPPGRTMVGIISTPTHLDFARNPGYALFAAALSAPWFPELGSRTPEQIREYLRGLGVEYVMWQRQGQHVITADMQKSLSDNPLPVFGKSSRNYIAIYNALDLGDIGVVIYKNGDYYVFRL